MPGSHFAGTICRFGVALGGRGGHGATIEHLELASELARTISQNSRGMAKARRTWRGIGNIVKGLRVLN